MKNILLSTLASFLFLLLAFSTQAQDSKTDANPVYDKFNDYCLLDKVEYQEERTIFHFRYKASSYTSIWLYSPSGDHPWFLKDEINGEEYKLLGVYNVRKNNMLTHKEVSGNYTYMNADATKNVTYFECEVHFERLPETVSEVDLIEGKGMEGAWNHFHCFNIKVDPLKDKQDLVIEPIKTEDIVLVPATELIEELIKPIDLAHPKAGNNETVAEETSNTSDNNNTALLTVSQTAAWSAFPVPATNVITIRQDDTQRAQLAIVNLNGQTVWTGRIQGTSKTVNVSKLSPGAYILYRTFNGEVTSQKLLIK
jgi:hypothetical protein